MCSGRLPTIRSVVSKVITSLLTVPPSPRRHNTLCSSHTPHRSCGWCPRRWRTLPCPRSRRTSLPPTLLEPAEPGLLLRVHQVDGLHRQPCEGEHPPTRTPPPMAIISI